MTNTKYRRAFAEYIRLGGFGGNQTSKLVFAQIAPELQHALTGKQIGAIAAALYKAYIKGQSSRDVDDSAGDALWIGYGVDKLIPLQALRSINIAERHEPNIPSIKAKVYTMDYAESL